MDFNEEQLKRTVEDSPESRSSEAVMLQLIKNGMTRKEAHTHTQKAVDNVKYCKQYMTEGEIYDSLCHYGTDHSEMILNRVKR